ncbi:hypothetical protein GN316_15505 [Xylophilus sp. Kf1]|nr:hypothetical protein [Xylophilus sp. Kf1]
MAERSLLSMAIDIDTETAALRDILGAYAGLEKLLRQRPGTDDDDPPLPMDRSELHGLIQLMNGGLHRQLELVEDTVRSLVATMRPGTAGTA